MDRHSRAQKKNTSHGNEVLPQDTTHLKNHVTNEEVRAKIQQAIGPHEDLLTIVKRRKLQRNGHVSSSSGLAKTILQGTVKGGRKTRQTEEEVGRQHQGMDRPGVCPSPRRQQKTGENGENWLQNYLWCPNDPRGYGIDDDDDEHTHSVLTTSPLTTLSLEITGR